MEGCNILSISTSFSYGENVDHIADDDNSSSLDGHGVSDDPNDDGVMQPLTDGNGPHTCCGVVP